MIGDMTEAIAFDTHRFVKRLTESGFTERQAETLAEEHVALLNANLATKADIAEIKADIDALRQETKADIDESRGQCGPSPISTRPPRPDIDALRQTTKADIEALRQSTTAAIATAKTSLLKWLFGAMIAQGGLIVALVKLL